MHSLITATFTRAHSVAASLAAVESTSPMPPSTQPSPSPPNLHLHRARLESAAGIASSPVRDPRYRRARRQISSAALTTTSHLICRRAHRCPPQTVAAALAAAALAAATVLTTTVLATTALATTSSRAFSDLVQISRISRGSRRYYVC